MRLLVRWASAFFKHKMSLFPPCYFIHIFWIVFIQYYMDKSHFWRIMWKGYISDHNNRNIHCGVLTPLCAKSNLYLILLYAQFPHQLFLLSSAPAALVRKDLTELSKKNNRHIGSLHTEYNTLLMKFISHTCRNRIEMFIVLCWTKDCGLMLKHSCHNNRKPLQPLSYGTISTC